MFITSIDNHISLLKVRVPEYISDSALLYWGNCSERLLTSHRQLYRRLYHVAGKKRKLLACRDSDTDPAGFRVSPAIDHFCVSNFTLGQAPTC